MALETGTRIGVYQVTGKLGEGGMGEVYRAHDTTLDRDVALKVLSEAFTTDPDRLARFQREAKVLASLNHPNIGGIHGLESAGETQALVLELIEGPTLADRIAEGPVPVDEALAIATQIAEALEAAHERGIVHRDLKPANVKLRPDGTVKVLDFGLAKAVTADGGVSGGSGAPTMSITGATQMGMVVGTAAYMAPEQARGKPVDQRADVWAFGVVLLEMLTGQRVFQGDDVSLTLAKVLEGEPKWDILPESVPPRVAKLLRRCLEKNPKQRMHAVGDVRLALEGAFETTAASEPSVVSGTARSLPVWQQPLGVVAVAVLAMAVTGAAVWTVVDREGLAQISRLLVLLEPGDVFTNTGRRAIGISPDGRYVAYQANLQIYLRAMDQMEASPVRGTGGNANSAGRSPTFSPDSEWIAFFHEGQIKKVAVTGGSPVALGDITSPWGLSWSPDGEHILIGQGPDGIVQVPATGGPVEVVVDVETGEQAQSPQLLPNGEWVVFTLRSDVAASWDEAQIVAQSLGTGERRTLINGGTDARYVPSGHLVYAQANTLLALPFDAAAVEVTPGPVPLVDDVGVSPGQTGSAHFSVSDIGTLVYVPNSRLGATTNVSGIPNTTFVWVDRSGNESAATMDSRPHQTPALSPDGGRLAFTDASGEADIWIYDFVRQTNQRLTFESGFETTPSWSPDGQRVAYYLQGVGVMWTNADGTGQPELLLESAGITVPATFVPDGSGLLINQGINDVALLSLADTSTLTVLLETEFIEGTLRLSPDGEWLAYHSDESGVDQVFVRPFPDVDAGLWQVSRGGGRFPVWSPDGDELFYVGGGGQLVATPVQTNPTFTPGIEQGLFEASQYFFGFRNGVQVAADGERFLMMKPQELATVDDGGPGARAQINVIQNWFQELEQRVPIP